MTLTISVDLDQMPQNICHNKNNLQYQQQLSNFYLTTVLNRCWTFTIHNRRVCEVKYTCIKNGLHQDDDDDDNLYFTSLSTFFKHINTMKG